jgi:hypothetical protein
MTSWKSLSQRKRRLIVAGAVAVSYAAGTVAARRMGYRFGRDVVVKCHAGHVFSTIWIPAVSFKALRLGLWRVQWCPVGRHVALIHPVRDVDLTQETRELAAASHDIPVP